MNLNPFSNQGSTQEKLVKRIGLTVAGIIVGIVLWTSFTETINQGHAGVVYNRSHGVEEKPLGQGIHFVNPLERITEYPVSTETVLFKGVPLATKDGKPLNVDITMEYLNQFDKLPAIYNKFKGASPDTIEDTWLKARLKDAALSVTSKYTILQIFQEREVISKEIEKQFVADVKGFGFDVENVVFGTPVPDQNTANAIQEVVNRQQELESLKIEKQKAELTAEKRLIEAQGTANAEIEEARGTAEANKIIQQSITPQLLKKMEMEARISHGWVTVNGGTPLVDAK